MKKELPTITVGELRRWLSAYDDNDGLRFGSGDLTFYRVKNRGPIDKPMAYIEFNEMYVTTDPADHDTSS